MEKDSKEILPSIDRLIDEDYNSIFGYTYVYKYHQALEASEKRVSELESELKRKDELIEKALNFIKEKRATTPGLGALKVILGGYEA